MQPTIALNQILRQVEKLNHNDSLNLNDRVVKSIYYDAETISRQVVHQIEKPGIDWDKTLDDILTSRLWGFPTMLLLLSIVFWITITGANYPSEILATVLFWGQTV